MSQSATLNLHLHPKQGTALRSHATEILYGGAAGGGKSHLMRCAAIIWCAAIAGLQVYLFRRIREDLVKNHVEGPKGFRALMAPWVQGGLVNIVEDEIRFWNGSKIYLCHCKDEKDRWKYLGAEIHVLLIDELTTFTDTIYRFLRGRVRAVGLPDLPEEYAGSFPRILAGSNPGSIGHQFVKAAFVDAASPMEIYRAPDSEGGMMRQFIPARLDDNPSMARDDPNYRIRLRGLGSEALVRAMEEGDWDVVVGAYFDCWDRTRHVIRPVELPEHWTRFRSFDWGSARPFSVGWWAVASEDFIHEGGIIPKNAMVRYREWYGAKEPNVGLKMMAEDVSRGIARRTDEKIHYSIADPAIFTEDGGPSIAERMFNADDSIQFRPGDNRRVARQGHVGGWDQLRARLVGEDGRPMLYVFDTCTDLIRTLPALQHDETRPEDVADGEDHAADECFVAGTLVSTVDGAMPIEELRVGDIVQTSDGPRPVSAVFSVGERDVFDLRTNAGRTLTGTANHPVYSDGYKPLSSLRYGDMLRTWNIPTDTAALPGKSGARHSARSHAITTSITRMATKPTTRWRTLSACRQAITAAFMPMPRRRQRSAANSAASDMRLAGPHGRPASVRTLANRLLDALRGLMTSLGSVPLAAVGSWPTASRISDTVNSSAHRTASTSGRPGHMSARNAERLSRPRTAAQCGVPFAVESVTPAGKQRVYNLTVDGPENYYANGVLVHNCRYACMSRPYTAPTPRPPEEMKGMEGLTMNELWKRQRPSGRKRV